MQKIILLIISLTLLVVWAESGDSSPLLDYLSYSTRDSIQFDETPVHLGDPFFSDTTGESGIFSEIPSQLFGSYLLPVFSEDQSNTDSVYISFVANKNLHLTIVVDAGTVISDTSWAYYKSSTVDFGNYFTGGVDYYRKSVKKAETFAIQGSVALTGTETSFLLFVKERNTFVANINFGLTNPDGFFIDKGEEFDKKGSGLSYGWDYNGWTLTDNSQDFDSVTIESGFVDNQFDNRWRISLPSGHYRVKLFFDNSDSSLEKSITMNGISYTYREAEGGIDSSSGSTAGSAENSYFVIDEYINVTEHDSNYVTLMNSENNAFRIYAIQIEKTKSVVEVVYQNNERKYHGTDSSVVILSKESPYLRFSFDSLDSFIEVEDVQIEFFNTKSFLCKDSLELALFAKPTSSFLEIMKTGVVPDYLLSGQIPSAKLDLMENVSEGYLSFSIKPMLESLDSVREEGGVYFTLNFVDTTRKGELCFLTKNSSANKPRLVLTYPRVDVELQGLLVYNTAEETATLISSEDGKEYKITGPFVDFQKYDSLNVTVVGYEGKTNAIVAESVQQVNPSKVSITAPKWNVDGLPTWKWRTGEKASHFLLALNDGEAFTTIEREYRPESPLSEGSHTLYVKSGSDLHGWWSASAKATVTVDKTAPLVSDIRLLKKNGKLIFSWNSSDSLCGKEERTFFYKLVSGSDNESSVKWKKSSTHKVKLRAIVSNEELVFIIKAKDAAGNESEPVRYSFTNETSAPIISNLSVSHEALPLISWEIKDNCTLKDIVVDYKVRNAQGVITEGSEKGLTSFTPPSELTESKYTFVITATDKAGNRSAVKKTTFLIDRTAPKIEIKADEFAKKLKASWVVEDNSPSVKTTCTLKRGDTTITVSPKISAKGKRGKIVCSDSIPDGVYTLTITTTDGRSTTIKHATIVKDTQNPVVTIELDAENGRYSWSASDQPYQGNTLNYQYCFGKESRQNKNFITTTETEVDQEGNKRLFVIAVDRAGNRSKVGKSERIIKNKKCRITVPADAYDGDDEISVHELGTSQIRLRSCSRSSRKGGQDLQLLAKRAKNSEKIIGEISQFEPEGTKFNGHIEVTIPYGDLNLTPEQEEVLTFYYLREKDSIWEEVDSVIVDKNKRVINAYLTHFSIYAAGLTSISTTPPQAKGINTAAPQVQPGDPMVGLREIVAPIPNNRGSAVIKYPFNIPKAAVGPTPSLGLTYNSEMKEDYEGYGWNLNKSTIQIDATKGCYYGDKTQYLKRNTFLYNGQELTYIESDNEFRIRNNPSIRIKYYLESGNVTVYHGDGSRETYGLNIGKVKPRNEYEAFYEPYLGMSTEDLLNSEIPDTMDFSENAPEYPVIYCSGKVILGTEIKNDLKVYCNNIELTDGFSVLDDDVHFETFPYDKDKISYTEEFRGQLEKLIDKRDDISDDEKCAATLALGIKLEILNNRQCGGFKWFLTEAIDPSGNKMVYDYEKVDLEGGTNYYPVKISYDFKNLGEADRTVELIWKEKDVKRISFRGKVSVIDAMRLDSVVSKYNNTEQFSYKLISEANEYWYSVLDTIKEYTYSPFHLDGKLINSHSFRYKKQENRWDVQSALPNVEYFLDECKGTRLGCHDYNGYGEIVRSNGQFVNFDGNYAFFNNENFFSKFTNSSAGMGVAFIDVNGDNLPDFLQSVDRWHKADHQFANVDLRREDIKVETGAGYYTSGSEWVSTPYDKMKPPCFFVRENQIDFVFDYGEERTIGLVKSGEDWSSYRINMNKGINDLGARFVDLNQDGRLDIIQSYWWAKGAYEKGAWFNTEEGWIPAGEKFHPPCYIVDNLSSATTDNRMKLFDNGVRLVDVNGDRRVDLVQNNHWASGKTYAGVWLNTKNGWQWSTCYGLPTAITESDYYRVDNKYNGRFDPKKFEVVDDGVRFIDLNGDGLLDIIKSSSYGSKMAWLNQGEVTSGSSWIPAPHRFSPPVDIVTNRYDHRGLDNGVRLLDLNGDNLTDMVFHNGDYKGAFINTGNGWIDAPSGLIPDYPLVRSEELPGFRIGLRNYTTVFDSQSDGIPDLIASYSYESGYVDDRSQLVKLVNKNKGIELEEFVNDITGRKVHLSYRAKNYGNNINKYCLDNITVENRLFSAKTTIEYFKPIYDHIEMEFRGYETVTTKSEDRIGNKTHWNITKTTYDNNRYTEVGGVKHYDPYIKNMVKCIQTSREIVSDEGVNEIITGRTEYSNKAHKFSDSKFGKMKHIYPSQVKTYIYDDAGVELAADVSSKTEYTYDANCLPTQVKSYAYNDIVNPDDNVVTTTTFTNDVTNWLLQPTRSESRVMGGNLLSKSETTYSGVYPVQTLTYPVDKHGNVGRGLTTTVEYDDTYGYPIKTTSPTGQTSEVSYEYNSGNYAVITTTTDAMGMESKAKIDKYGRLAESIDAFSDVTQYSYDKYGRVTSVEEIVNGVMKETSSHKYWEETHDEWGKLWVCESRMFDDHISGNNFYTRIFKDALGRNIQTQMRTWVDGEEKWVTSGWIERDDMGRALSVGVSTVHPANIIVAGNIWAEPVYDNNKESSLGTSNSKATKYTYDDWGRVETVVSPTSKGDYTVDVSYDISKDFTEDKSGKSRILSKVHKKASWTEGEKVETRESEEFTDLEGQTVISRTLGEDATEWHETTFDYDLDGTTTLKEPTGITGTTYTGPFGVDSVITPDAGKTVYTYDDYGRLLKSTQYGLDDMSSYKETCYEYDEFERIIDIKYTNVGITDCVVSDNVGYSYYETDENGDDAKYRRGAIKSLTKGTYSVEYDYGEDWLKVTKVIDGTPYTTTYNYDLNGRSKSIELPDNGGTIEYAYDKGGNLSRVYKGSQNYLSGIKYNMHGQRTKLYHGNGARTTYTYDPLSNLLQTMNAGSKIEYTYDFTANGLLSNITDNAGVGVASSQTYEYDNLGRITKGSGTAKGDHSYTESYEFDGSNRMIKKSFDGGIEYHYNYRKDPNDLTNLGNHAVKSIAVTYPSTATASEKKLTAINFAYDDFGNMTQKQSVNGSAIVATQSYKYDTENRIREMGGLAGGKTAKYQYSADGGRIMKEILNSSGDIIKKDIYVNGSYTIKSAGADSEKTPAIHVSDGVNVFATIPNKNDDEIKYYTQNNIGSTVMLTDADGTDIHRYLYTPFGQLFVDSKPDDPDPDVDRLFTGQMMDDESDLYYMNARYYDPETAVFLRPDPAMDGVNHYGYVSGNPISYTDPTGLSEEVTETWWDYDIFAYKYNVATSLWDYAYLGYYMDCAVLGMQNIGKLGANAFVNLYNSATDGCGFLDRTGLLPGTYQGMGAIGNDLTGLGESIGFPGAFNPGTWTGFLTSSRFAANYIGNALKATSAKLPAAFNSAHITLGGNAACNTLGMTDEIPEYVYRAVTPKQLKAIMNGDDLVPRAPNSFGMTPEEHVLIGGTDELKDFSHFISTSALEEGAHTFNMNGSMSGIVKIRTSGLTNNITPYWSFNKGSKAYSVASEVLEIIIEGSIPNSAIVTPPYSIPVY